MGEFEEYWTTYSVLLVTQSIGPSKRKPEDCWIGLYCVSFNFLELAWKVTPRRW